MKRFNFIVQNIFIVFSLCLASVNVFAACNTPFALTISQITTTSARVSWIDFGNSWEIEVVPDGSSPTGIPTYTTTTKPFTMTDLMPCTGYRVFIRATCSPTMVSSWSSGKSFYTALTNPSCCNLNYFIGDNTTTNHYIEVQNAGGTLLGSDIALKEVRLIIEHTWAADLDISLKSPSGVIVELSSDNGDGDNNYGNPLEPNCASYTSLISPSSFAGCTIPSVVNSEAPFSGQYTAEGDLSAFNDLSNPNGLWTIVLTDDAPSDFGYLRSVELVFETFYCKRPSQAASGIVSAHTASLSWTPGSACATTIIEYGPTGFIPGTQSSAGQGQTVEIPCPVSFPYVLSGLTDDTNYDFYIRESCTGGGFSENTCSGTFTTHCDVPPASLSEDFDTLLVCNTSCLDACAINSFWHNADEGGTDWIVHTGSSPSSDTGPSGDIHGDGNYIYFETSGCSDNLSAILITDCLDVPAVLEGVCHMSFYYHMYGSTIGALDLEISEDGGSTWVLLWNKTGNQGNNWFKQFIDLSGYEGQTVQMRFAGTKFSGVKGDMAIDQIEFYGATPSGNPQVYFADQDSDGYGNPQIQITSCSEIIPEGFVTDNTDCDDTQNAIYPGSLELLCNLTDEDCDGLDDDQVLARPEVINQDICTGNSAFISINTTASGNYYWYANIPAGEPIFSGNDFITPNLDVNWVVYIRDSLQLNENYSCYSAYDTVLINVRPYPQINTIGTPTICSGAPLDLQAIDISGSNLIGVNYTYHTSTPGTAQNMISPQINPVSNTTYYIKATSAFGCSDETPVNVLVNPLPTPQILQGATMDLCIGTVGTLNASESGTGIQPITWQWSNGSINQQITILSNGSPGTIHSYVLSATDANNCTAKDTIDVTLRQSIQNIEVALSPVTTCNSSNGVIDLSFTSNYPPFGITWSGATSGSTATFSQDFTISGLAEGTYNVTITDSAPQSCPVVLPFLIINGPNVSVRLDSIRQVSCHGGTDGGIFLTITGNTPDAISWSYNNITTPDITGIAAGLYSVTVTAGQCEAILQDIMVNQPEPLLAFVQGVKKSTCFGINNASIDINVAGGTVPYTYHWNNNGQLQDPMNLSPGFYSVTVTDLKGCIATLSSILIEPTDPLSANAFINHPTCWYSTDGSIDISPLGGTPPYQYLWNNSQPTEDILDIGNGSYHVEITDANGCNFTSANLQVNAVPAITISSIQVSAPTCLGIDNASIDITVTGGYGDYIYTWNNDAVSQDLQGLSPGNYKVTITDSVGCQLVSPTIPVVAPTLMNFLPFIENATCQGLDNGSILLYTNGGTPPYDIQWNNGAESLLITGLGAGDYFATVTDDNGCQQMTPVWNITPPQLLHAQIDLIDPVRCYGESNGKIFLTFTGGVPDYTTLWDNGMSGDDFTNLPSGNYILTLTDAEGCRLTDTFFIPQPAPLEAVAVNIDPVICFGECNGSIDLQVTGGNPPYAYSWLNGVTQEDQTDLCPGEYQSNISDSRGCISSTEAFILSTPEQMTVEIDVVSNVSCDGNNGGSISLEVNGGMPAYSFSWNTGDTIPGLFDLTGGEYDVTITDANGCAKELESIKVVEPTAAFQVDTIIVIQPVTCSGASDGILYASLAGGTPPYQYNWSFNNGNIHILVDDHDQMPQLQGGHYNLTVTDNSGCVAVSDSILLPEPAPLSYVANVTNIACFGDTSGAIMVTSSGGTMPYTYLWNTGDTMPQISQLSAGEYLLTITDINGCTYQTDPIVIHTPVSGPYVSNVDIQAVDCYGDASGTIGIVMAGGSPPFFFDWNNDLHTSLITQLTTGEYWCTVSDNNGCLVFSDTFVVSQPNLPLSVQTDNILQNICFNGADGAIFITPVGGTPPYDYDWNNQTYLEDATGLGNGSYRLTVTDSHQCMQESPLYHIMGPSDFNVITDSTNTSAGNANGSASVFVSGATPPYDYLWDENADAQTTATAINLVSGIYTVTITDANDCTVTAAVTVEETVGVAEFNAHSLYIYPNPTTGRIFIHAEIDFFDTVTYKLYDATGMMISERNEIGAQDVEITDLTYYASGVYWLHLIQPEGSNLVFPIIKL